MDTKPVKDVLIYTTADLGVSEDELGFASLRSIANSFK